MAEFKLDRFKFTWKGAWTSATEYLKDDIVSIGGKSYVCLISHQSSTNFANELNRSLPGSNPPQPQPYWIVMTGGREFVGDYTLGVKYAPGMIVVNDGGLWLCTIPHEATNFAQQITFWSQYLDHIAYVGNWIAGTDYAPGALVKYNGIVYKCRTAHGAGSTLEDDIAKWTVFYQGNQWRGSWVGSTEYRQGDWVLYGGAIFECVETHTSADLSVGIDAVKFQARFPGSKYANLWDDSTLYAEGDIVRYGGYLYVAKNNNIASDPTGTDSTNDWLILVKTNDYVGEWQRSGRYQEGDIVQRGGYLYEAQRDINEGDGDDSASTYLDDTYWRKILEGQRWRATWTQSEYYEVGDTVYFLGSMYTCNFEHTSDIRNHPGDNGNGITYWDLEIQAGGPAGMEVKGDLLTYNFYRAYLGDDSALADGRLAIGETNQILSVTDEQEIFWRNRGYESQVVHVGTNGKDQPGFGRDVNSPFRTVRHACEWIEDNFNPGVPTKVAVAAGTFDEIGPISIPAGCVVMGDELRATTIRATTAKPEYEGDYDFHNQVLSHFLSFADDLIQNIPVTKSAGNTEEQNTSLAPGGIAAYTRIIALADDYRNRITFLSADGEVNPTIVGTNTLSTDTDFSRAAAVLKANREFIIKEVLAYIPIAFPTFDLNEAEQIRIRNDVDSFVRGFQKDCEYNTSNYYTVTAGTRYGNAVTGSQLTDMFYVRDTTGLRNCTIEGLSGGLNPPGVYDIYQRPTGGACVALDPGWGPADERVWIKNRSPYIQGVTNIGERCYGKKIDGNLHNGGNRSMTSNDFTQVLSDGIGAYVTNNARAELVSVFTYYCAVGYLAENGGVIRATNGNNSYGSFGSVSDGNDPLETPDAITVFNRENEALVNTGFAGGDNDEFFIFQYNHCGEQYTEVEETIKGAGEAVNIEYSDFRDGGVSNIRLINTTGSGQEGGAGYKIIANSAQITVDATSTLRLNTNDPTQFLTDIEGMRVIITSGKGAGQYGYISGFDVVTKDITVRKDSDGTLGWDHIIPGTDLVADFDSTTNYRIEARVIATAPTYTSESGDLPAGRTWAGLEYDYTTKTYVSVPVGLGTGETFDDDPIAATFTVVRAGTTYTLTQTSGGAGYAEGDVLTIAGNLVGGATPANDITIEVRDTSDDSTNGITLFTYSGTPRYKRFVGCAQPNFAVYSDDGESWTEVNASITGDMIGMAAGSNAFVIAYNNSNQVSFSYDGEEWITRSLPATDNWVDITYGNGAFMIVAEGSNTVVTSADGLSWTSRTIPDSADSTTSQYQKVAYGQGVHCVISGSDLQVARTANNGATFSLATNAFPAGDYDFAAFAYGNNRFMAITTDNRVLYSLDRGVTFKSGTSLPLLNGADTMIVKDLTFSNGVFFVTGTAEGSLLTQFALSSEDGIIWTERGLDANDGNWGVSARGRDADGDPCFVTFADDKSSNGVVRSFLGKQAKFRADIFQGKFQNMMIWDPGSGYSTDNACQLTITDTAFTSAVELDVKYGDQVLPQPDFINRGAGYRTSSSTITLSGDGFAEIIPEDNTVVVTGVNVVPGPGAQIRFDTIENEDTEDPDDLKLFTAVGIEDLGDDGLGAGTNKVRFTLSPRLRNENNLAHGTAGTIRLRYSQCRITGHDFLDIGTGNFEETNYPELYAGGAYFTSAPENEVEELNGGRVFYVSTDQDGNFRAGELFSVQQATGIVTISAEFFDLDGLSELALGGVRLGGSGAVVREFSTDPTFSEDSNNVVPTQRAVATFLADRLSVGGSDLETNRIVAGRVGIGGEENVIDMTDDSELQFRRVADFSGADSNGNVTAIQGMIIGQMMLAKDFVTETQGGQTQ